MRKSIGNHMSAKRKAEHDQERTVKQKADPLTLDPDIYEKVQAISYDPNDIVDLKNEAQIIQKYHGTVFNSIQYLFPHGSFVLHSRDDRRLFFTFPTVDFDADNDLKSYAAKYHDVCNATTVMQQGWLTHVKACTITHTIRNLEKSATYLKTRVKPACREQKHLLIS